MGCILMWWLSWSAEIDLERPGAVTDCKELLSGQRENQEV